MGDAIRWACIVMCVFNLGVMAALFERVGRLFLPRTPMRLLAFGYALTLIALAGGSHARLGESLTWRSPVTVAALAMQFVALLLIHRWYATEDGRWHAEKMANRQ